MFFPSLLLIYCGPFTLFCQPYAFFPCLPSCIAFSGADGGGKILLPTSNESNNFHVFSRNAPTAAHGSLLCAAAPYSIVF
jgi:hypothetical protein